jgi:hypothetical protein
VCTLRLYKIYHFPITSHIGLTTGKHYRAAVITYGASLLAIDVKYVDPKNKIRKNAFFIKKIKYVKIRKIKNVV